MKRDSALMFTCCLIEYLGREYKLRRSEVVRLLGTERIRRIYRHANVLHSEPIESVAYEYATMSNMQAGDFDNVSACRYDVPDYWTIGEVYERLIEDVASEPTTGIIEVYSSWIDDAISNYNTDFFYQPRDYLRECFLEGSIL